LTDVRRRDLLNGVRGAPRTFARSGTGPNPDDLSSLQAELVQFYSSTPVALSWSATNFKEYISRNQGGVSRPVVPIAYVGRKG
jgi:hypothetical protein